MKAQPLLQVTGELAVAGELGCGVQALGLMTMGFAFAQFLLSPFMGSCADGYARRPLILVGLSGEVLMVIAPNIEHFLSSRVGFCLEA
jgi:predicted MFS family arabinose efflux permease